MPTMFRFPVPFLNADPGGGGGGEPNPAPAPNPTPAPQPAPAGKTYSEDYVKALRDESAAHRVKAKTYEGAVRQALGLKDADNIPDDVSGALAGLKAAGQQEASKTVETAKAAMLKAAFMSASAGKVVDVDDAFALAGVEMAEVELDPTTFAVTVKKGADGKDRTMADLVEAFLKRKPHMKAGGAPNVGGSTPPGDGGKPDPKEIAKKIAEARTQNQGTSSFWK